MTIQLVKKGKVILFDSADWAFINQYRWNVIDGGYVTAAVYNNVNKKSNIVYLHRILLNVSDRKMYVDHINRNTLDNRRCNLRLATPTQSVQNRKSGYGKYPYAGVTTTTRYIGDKKYEYIKAVIVIDGKSKYLGLHKTAEDAARAYNNAAIKYFGEFANLNIV